MATVTNTGITALDLLGYKSLLESRFKAAFGQDLALDPETPQGQIISIMALALTEIDESLIDLSNAMSVSAAVGLQLDDLGTLLGIGRTQATKSRVTAQVTGASGTLIPSGTLFRTSAGDNFRTISNALITSSGVVDVTAEALVPGSIPVDAGALIRISSLVNGIVSVTNTTAGAVGEDAETDKAYRARYRDLTAKNTLTTIDAVKARLIELVGVKAVVVLENSTSAAKTLQSKQIKGHSIYVVVDGGNQADIIQSIIDTKGLGVDTNGSVFARGVRYDAANKTSLKIRITTKVETIFLSLGIEQMKLDIVAEVNKLNIGESVDQRRIVSAANQTEHHTISSSSITLKNGNAITGPALNNLYVIDAADVVINTTV